jgi:membrane protein
MQSWWPLIKNVFTEWNKHDAPRMGASLAFYTILSLSPLLVLAVAIAGIFLDRAEVLEELTGQIQRLVGPVGAQAVDATLKGARNSSAQANIASIVSILLLLISASGVFGELRTALNKIWEVQPVDSSSLRGMLRERIFSFGMVLAIGFLLLASLVLSAGLAAAASFLGDIVPMPHLLAGITDLVISLAGVSAVFALTFKYVPAARIGWREAWMGGALTALLFTVGKYLIGVYLAKAAVGSAYGVAGSVVVVIVWVYYTAQIFYFGAEFTHVLGSNAPARMAEPSRAAPFRVRSQRPQQQT